MTLFTHHKSLKAYLSPLLKNNETIGFVPTMGALHQGHLSLLKQSLKANDHTVISIFVNPTQFNNAEDLEKYPRNLEADIEKVKNLNPSILVYAPSVDDIYGKNIKSELFDYDGLENLMEGKSRPGHFDGVGTIVKKLFEIVQPTRAYFGEKDYQQTLIIKKLVQKHNIPVKIQVCPILREKSGLAMSSRNERLTPNEKEKASFIYATLQKAKELFGSKTKEEIYAFVEKTFKNNPQFQLEYFTITDSKTLLEPTKFYKTKKYRAFIVVNVGKVRLIDTISLN